ncbi:MAG TPA: efflux RND transporter periplasmic adaptor subunit [Caulobacteraceae bacterium]|nr:efflux RND transporter periplasmic adaptor subunit [Caulobacteraceae bacterium]
MNTDSFVNQLKINRSPDRPPTRTAPPGWRAAAAAAAGVLALVAVVWFLIARPDLAHVDAAEARGVAASGSQNGPALLDASGYVVAQRQATVSSKITGKVSAILIEEGQHVQAGQVLARLDDSNARANQAQSEAAVLQAEANVALAKATLEDATIKYQRYRSVSGQGVISEQAIADARTPYDNAVANLAVSQSQVAVARAALQAARQATDDTVVRAPFSGVVTVKAAQPGEMVSPVSAGGGFTRTGICTIVDMDSLEVDVDVAESFINKVVAGNPAVVKLNAYPDWSIPAYVIAIIPTADRSKATVTVRLGLKTKDARVLPEMGANVTFQGPGGAGSPSGARSVIVPAAAVTTTDNGQAAVFVVNAGRVERRAVRLGAQTGDEQVLLAGVQPGEIVAINANKPLTDGVEVRVSRLR